MTFSGELGQVLLLQSNGATVMDVSKFAGGGKDEFYIAASGSPVTDRDWET